MENTTQPKKINWGMIVLLVILVPILLLGYKFISKKIDGNDTTIQTANNITEQNNGFPLVGEWNYKDTGADLKYVNDKYNFSEPQMVNGVMKGQITMTMEWMESVKTLNYEVIKDGKLRISDPSNQSPTYEMDYTYNPASQTLEVSDQGYKLTYTRNGNGNNGNNNSGNSANQNTNQLTASAQQLAGALWKLTQTDNGDTFHFTRTYNNIRTENGHVVFDYKYTSKQEGNFCVIESHRKCTMISSNQYSWEIISQTCGKDPYEQQEIGTKGNTSFEVNGNTLLTWKSEEDISQANKWTR